MGWGENDIQVAWTTETTNVCQEADNITSDDVTLTDGPWERTAFVKAQNVGDTEASLVVDVYWQEKEDPDNDTTEEYTNQGDYLGSLDCGTGADDPAIKGLMFGSGSKTGRFYIENNGTTDDVEIDIRIVETVYTA